MPYKKRYAPRRRRFAFRRRKPTGFATVPRMMLRSLARKRFNQVSTKVFYFKDNGQIENNSQGTYQKAWSPQNLVTASPEGWDAACGLYDEFKCLAMTVKLFPANVGIESDTAVFVSQGLLRGDCIVWSDQKADATPGTISSISQKINQASCRMINPRRPYTRRIFRSTGNPEWGGTAVPATAPDRWIGTINIFGQNTTEVVVPNPPIPLWYWTRQYKVIFRGRINP